MISKTTVHLVGSFNRPVNVFTAEDVIDQVLKDRQENNLLQRDYIFLCNGEHLVPAMLELVSAGIDCRCYSDYEVFLATRPRNIGWDLRVA